MTGEQRLASDFLETDRRSSKTDRDLIMYNSTYYYGKADGGIVRNGPGNFPAVGRPDDFNGRQWTQGAIKVRRRPMML